MRLRQALIVLCALVFVFSAVKLILYLRSSVRTASINEELRELHEASLETSITEAGVQREASAKIPNSEAVAPQTVAELSLDDLGALEKDSDSAEEDPRDLRDGEYQRVGGEISWESGKLYEINPDLVAWLNIPNVVNLPVVYRDNSYYLTHDFYGAENDSGTLFLDVHHPLERDTQYLFIHGHNMYDSSMFGMLTHYRRTEYIKAHPELTLNTLYSHDTYEIVGSLFLSESEMMTVAGLGKPSFTGERQFEMFIETLRAHAMHFTDAEIPPDSALLALSTCFEDGRIVVLFRRTATEALE